MYINCIKYQHIPFNLSNDVKDQRRSTSGCQTTLLVAKVVKYRSWLAAPSSLLSNRVRFSHRCAVCAPPAQSEQYSRWCID